MEIFLKNTKMSIKRHQKHQKTVGWAVEKNKGNYTNFLFGKFFFVTSCWWRTDSMTESIDDLMTLWLITYALAFDQKIVILVTRGLNSYKFT